MSELNLIMEDYLPLRDVVFHTLRNAILTGKLKPGERLMEIHLAETLGVSRTPVREAIHKLELEGLVVMIPRRGAQVAQISQKALKDVLEVRRALDTLCAELACIRINDDEKNLLKKACLDFENATKSKDATIIAKADVAFHDIIIKATGNEKLVTLINNISEQIYRYRFEYIKDESLHLRLINEHKTLVNAILAGDVDAARNAARVHIDNQERSILSQLNIE